MIRHQKLLADLDAWLQTIRGEEWHSATLLAVRVEAWLLRYRGGGDWAVTPTKAPGGGHVHIWIDVPNPGQPAVRSLVIRNGRIDIEAEDTPSPT